MIQPYYLKRFLQARESSRVAKASTKLCPVAPSNLCRVIVDDADELNPWFYALDLDGCHIQPGIYPPDSPKILNSAGLINRQNYRALLLVEEVRRRFEFTGKRILDLGCNCGYWSSVYISRYHARSVIGIEGRELFIKQASLLYKGLGIENMGQFIQGNVLEYDYGQWKSGFFPFVLCAGILYHIGDWQKLLQQVAPINSEVLVVDTRVAEEDDHITEKKDMYFNAIEATRNKVVPGKSSLLNVLGGLGYEVEQIMPRFKSIHGVEGGDDYTKENRICLFCRK